LLHRVAREGFGHGTKPGGNIPKQNDAEGKRNTVGIDEDLQGDVEFDLLDETDEDTQNDVFSRDTAIPTSPAPQLAAEAMRKLDAKEQARLKAAKTDKTEKPRVPPPPPMRPEQHTPVTLELSSEDLEFDAFDAPIDVFGHPLPGAKPNKPAERRDFGQSQRPTAPPAAGPGLLDKSRRTSPAPSRANRPAFMMETARNNPADAERLARSTLRGKGSSQGRPAYDDKSEESPDSALDFVSGLDPLLDSLAPMAGLEPAAARPDPDRPGDAKELLECYELGDYSRALQIAEQLLARSPDDLAVRRQAQNCRDALTQMFAARIGPLDQVISVVVSPAEVQWLSLDHRAGFLLSLIDGQSTVDEILDISGMTRLDALKIMCDLAEQHVVKLA
jgi:hypothetical protein